MQKSGAVLLIAPALSYRVASYIQAAQKLQLQILLVSNSQHSLVSEIAQGITVDFNHPEQAFKKVMSATQNMDILAVIGTDDQVVTLTSKIARSLDLPHNDPEASRLTFRKDLARLQLKKSKCNVPEFTIACLKNAESNPEELKYPVVIKPLMLSGSRGVIRCNNVQEYLNAVPILNDILQQEQASEYETTHFLIEEYLEGEEVAVDAFMRSGKLIPLALFDKPEPLEGPYFEESYYITPSRQQESRQQAIWQEIERCCHAYGLQHGPIHAEARITSKGVVLIEMASRTIGGQCAQLIEYSLGQPLEEVIIQLMCRQPLKKKTAEDYAGVLMIPIEQKGLLKRIEGLTEAQKITHITSVEIFIQPGYELVPLPQGASYLGFIFSRAETFDATWDALKKAHSKLKFITGDSWVIETN